MTNRELVEQLWIDLYNRDFDAVGAAFAGEIERQTAPARADVEQAVARTDQKLRSKMAFLGKLSVVKRRIRRLEIAAAVLLVGI